jgi:hypothetical protein
VASAVILTPSIVLLTSLARSRGSLAARAKRAAADASGADRYHHTPVRRLLPRAANPSILGTQNGTLGSFTRFVYLNSPHAETRDTPQRNPHP